MSDASPQFVDIHCHILPGIDDGPVNLEQSVQLARLLVQQNVGHVVATPHQLCPQPHVLASVPPDQQHRQPELASRSSVLRLVDELNQALVQRRIPLLVHPGGEVHIVPNLIEQLDAGVALTLCDHNAFVLVELPFDHPLPARGIIQQLHQRGLGVILAHPERYASALQDPGFLDDWIEHHAMLQINADSLCGDHGNAVQKLALSLIETGKAHFVASDAHGNGRPPRLAQAFELLKSVIPLPACEQLFIHNPAKVIKSSAL